MLVHNVFIPVAFPTTHLMLFGADIDEILTVCRVMFIIVDSHPFYMIFQRYSFLIVNRRGSMKGFLHCIKDSGQTG